MIPIMWEIPTSTVVSKGVFSIRGMGLLDEPWIFGSCFTNEENLQILRFPEHTFCLPFMDWTVLTGEHDEAIIYTILEAAIPSLQGPFYRCTKRNTLFEISELKSTQLASFLLVLKSLACFFKFCDSKQSEESHENNLPCFMKTFFLTYFFSLLPTLFVYKYESWVNLHPLNFNSASGSQRGQ